MTSENVRYHAAGHLAAAALLAQSQPEAARVILRVVDDFARHDKVQSPPQIKEMIGSAINDPAANLKTIVTLETWFVDPFNTIIERSGS